MKLRRLFRVTFLTAALAAALALTGLTLTALAHPVGAAEREPVAPAAPAAPADPVPGQGETGTPWIVGTAAVTLAIGTAMVVIGNRRGPGERR